MKILLNKDIIKNLKIKLEKYRDNNISSNKTLASLITKVLIKIINKIQPEIYIANETILLSKYIFNEDYYLKNNPKVSAYLKSHNISAKEHWCQIGIYNGLVANSIFDIKYYLKNNNDLKKYFKKRYHEVAKHWVEHGIKEGRNSSPQFHLTYYYDKYEDLQKAFGRDYHKLANHWLVHGYKEGRDGVERKSFKSVNLKSKRNNDKFIQTYISNMYDSYLDKKNSPNTLENQYYTNELLLTDLYSKNPKDKKVSIILATWNRKKLISKAIDSVLQQTYDNFELLIIDDGSTDGTIKFLNKKYSKEINSKTIKIIENPHKGVSYARNSGLKESNGPIIAYIDSDNEWLPNYLLLMVNSLEKSKIHNCIYSGILILDSSKDNYRILLEEEFDSEKIRKSNYIDLNCFVHTKELYNQLGGFNESLTRLVDWDLILKYTYNNPPIVCKSILVKYYMLDNVLHISKSADFYTNFYKINDTEYGSQDIFSEFNKISEDKSLEHHKNDSKLRIAYVLWQFPVLSETFIINELRWLINNNYDVKVYFNNVPEKKAVLDFEIDHKQVSNPNDLVKGLINDNRNIMHGHFIYPTITELVYPAAELAKIPFTMVGHGVDIFHYNNIKKMNLHIISKSKYFKKIFALGNFHRLYYMQHQVPESKIAITPQAVPYSFFSKEEIMLKNEFKYSVCCITRFVEKKGIEYLIKSAKYISNIDINLYGFGELEDEYKSIVQNEKITNVHFKGVLKNRDEVLSVLLENDLFILPCVRANNGDMDGVPTVFMESLAAGVPVVTTNISSISDIIVDGKTGFISKPYDERSLADKIKQFYSLSDQEIFAIKMSGRKKVSLNHNINHSMKRNVNTWSEKGVDIFLVTYNAYDELKEIIRRVYKYTDVHFNLIIIDNNSPDIRVKNYLYELESKVDNLKLVMLEDNIYCGPASNIALEKAESDYSIYLCSNEGYVLKHNWEWELIKYMDENPKVGIAGHLSYSPLLYNLEGIQKLELFSKFRNQEYAINNPKKLFKHVQGGLYIVRNKMVQEIGGFNMQTPQGFMDVEYSYYAESMGWEIGSINNLYSITVKTLPTLDSLIDENTIAAHPLSLEKIKHFELITNNEIKKCNICNSHFESFIRKGNDLSCENCGSSQIHRALYRFIAGTNWPYRKLKLLNTFNDFKGIGKIKKMFTYQQSSINEYIDSVISDKLDLIFLYFDNILDDEKLRYLIDKTKNNICAEGKILVYSENTEQLLHIIDLYKHYNNNIKLFYYNSTSIEYTNNSFILIENISNIEKEVYNDSHIIIK